MPSKPHVDVQNVNTQRGSRWLATVTDQHKSPRFPLGRPFHGYVEVPAERRAAPGFVEQFKPGDHNDPLGSLWNAPWIPDQVAQTDGSGARSTYRLDMVAFKLTWNYAGIIADDLRYLEAYYELAARVAYEKGWTAPAFGSPIPYQLRTNIGPPGRSPKIAQAALAEDPWLLGYTDVVNVELQGLLKGVRPHELAQQEALLSRTDVLAGNDIEAIVAKAVAAALANERAVNKAKGERMRAGKKKTGKGSQNAGVAA